MTSLRLLAVLEALWKMVAGFRAMHQLTLAERTGSASVSSVVRSNRLFSPAALRWVERGRNMG